MFVLINNSNSSSGSEKHNLTAMSLFVCFVSLFLNHFPRTFFAFRELWNIFFGRQTDKDRDASSSNSSSKVYSLDNRHAMHCEMSEKLKTMCKNGHCPPSKRL